MSGPYECQVRLYRDALSTPWGFRLQGGKDFKQPLSVQRVFVGSPADGELSRGDVILSINNYDAAQLLHKQAQDIIKDAGGSVDLGVKRAHPGRPSSSTITKPALPATTPSTQQGFRSRPVDKVGPASPQQKMGTNYSPSYGVSYGGGGRQPAPTYMLNRIQENLNQAIYSGAGQQYNEDEDEPHRSVGELKSMFVDRQPPAAPHVQHIPKGNPSQPRRNQPPPPPQQTMPRQQYYRTEEQQNYYSDATDLPPPPLPYVDFHPNQNQYQQYQQYAEGEVDQDSLRSVNELKNMWIDTARRERPSGATHTWPPGHVKDLKSRYNKIDRDAGTKKIRMPPAPRHRPRPRPTQPSWVKPDPNLVPPPTGLSEPGRQFGAQPGWQPVQAPRTPPSHISTYRPPPVNAAPPAPAPPPSAPSQVPRPPPMAPQQVPHIMDDGRPAWTGTLKSSGGPKPWEQQAISGGGPAPMSPSGVVQPHQPRVQTTHFGPGGNIEYKQSPQGQDSEHARIQHLQYNSPIGLYSKENVQDVLKGQTQGRPGDGTMQVTGGATNKAWDPTRSDVLRMVHEEDTRRKHRPADTSARYVDHAPGEEMAYHGYQDHNKQSRSMQALQAHFPDERDMGTSDF